MNQNASHPKTFEELRSNFALPPTAELLIETGCCSICLEPYEFTLLSEVPLRLPVCGHVFGDICISEWITDEHNTCPMCRRFILKNDDIDTVDQIWRESLAVWHLTASGAAPTAFAVRAEASFVNLCEAIVRWIENQDDAIPSAEAEEWICFRSPHVAIISLATFQDFAAIIRGPWDHRVDWMFDLQARLPDPAIVAVVMGYALQWNGSEDLLEPSEETYRRLAEWYRRIEQSRICLYERLYGGNRRPSTSRGSNGRSATPDD